MSRQVFDYSGPDRFVVGTVGMPGERTFFLQARKGSAITSVALEKAQVAALGRARGRGGRHDSRLTRLGELGPTLEGRRRSGRCCRLARSRPLQDGHRDRRADRTERARRSVASLGRDGRDPGLPVDNLQGKANTHDLSHKGNVAQVAASRRRLPLMWCSGC